MSYLKSIRPSLLALSLFFLSCAVGNSPAQDDSSLSSGNSNSQAVADSSLQGPATRIAGSIIEPPISGLDQPSVEPGEVTRSFLSPGVIVSESADSNVSSNLGSGTNTSGTGGVTRAMASVTLLKLGSRHVSEAQYIGGGIFYQGVSHDATQMQEAELAEKVLWRKGQLALRDSLSYLPEGTFGGGSYGGSGALQSGLAGLGTGSGTQSSVGGSSIDGALSAAQFGSVGQTPRLTNSSAVDVVEALTPKSSLTAVGSYAFVHFSANPIGLADSDQFAGQVAYDYQLDRRNQVAVSYGFQKINFPQIGGASVSTNTVHLLYGHRLSGRMDFVVGAGPQFTNIQSPLFGDTNRISASGNVKLRYRFSRTAMQLEYKHYNTNGSGFFLGSSTDAGSISVLRPLSRVWEANADLGVANNSRLLSALSTVPASSDQYLFAGGAAHRHLGRRSRLFVSYQYNRFSFSNSVCLATGDCGRISNRHMGVVGVEWYPRPIRLD